MQFVLKVIGKGKLNRGRQVCVDWTELRYVLEKVTESNTPQRYRSQNCARKTQVYRLRQLNDRTTIAEL